MKGRETILKKNSMRVFTAVMIAGVVGILIITLIRTFSIRLLNSYEEFSSYYSETASYIFKITNGIYDSQASISKFIAAESDDEKIEYIEDSKKTLDEISDMFEDLMGSVKKYSESEDVIPAYTTFLMYKNYVDMATRYSENGNNESAVYYANRLIEPYARKVTNELEEINLEVKASLDEKKSDVDRKFVYLKTVTIISIIGIAISSTMALIYSVRVTSELEKYKIKLEKEIEDKNKALRDHSDKMLRLQDQTIIGMANLIESRDGNTGEHVKRTSKYVEIIARKAMQRGLYTDILNENYIELLVKAAPLHDIGKIAVPDAILQKPSKLTAEEFEKIKAHTTDGGRIIKDVLGNIEEKDYLKIAENVALSHHEKWDGTGYPNKLSSIDIPLEARIMALADVFDALVSKRCYKDAYSTDEAFDIIEKSKGTHFDPKLTNIFLELKPEIEKYLKSHGENK